MMHGQKNIKLLFV